MKRKRVRSEPASCGRAREKGQATAPGVARGGRRGGGRAGGRAAHGGKAGDVEAERFGGVVVALVRHGLHAQRAGDAGDAPLGELRRRRGVGGVGGGARRSGERDESVSRGDGDEIVAARAVGHGERGDDGRARLERRAECAVGAPDRERSGAAAGRPPHEQRAVDADAAGAEAAERRAAARGERRRAVGVEVDDHDLPRRRRQRERALRAAADERAVADLRALRVVAVAVARRRDALKRQRHARRADLVGAVVVLPARQRRVVERERERRLDVAVLAPRRVGEEVEVVRLVVALRAERRLLDEGRGRLAPGGRGLRGAGENCGEQEGAAHRP